MDGDKRKKRRRWLLVALAVVIAIVVLFSILGATVFKEKRPITTVKSVALRDFDVSFDALRVKVHLNVSLDVSITIKNPNKVGFKYRDSSAFMDYRGQVVGQAPVPAGQISAGQTVPVNLTLTLMAERLIANSQAVVSDLLSGNLPLSTRTHICGKVNVLFFKIHFVSKASCHLNISVASQSTSNSDCTYDTRLS